jgi:hypothetical protein
MTKKKLWNRESLKGFFQKGKVPTEVHFEYLIESNVNKLDDGFNRTDENGLLLAPTSSSNNIISLLKDPVAEHPSWQISLQTDENGTGFSLGNIQETADDRTEHVPRLFLTEEGKVGINTTAPKTTLDVEGTIACKTRVGAFKFGEVPGDGHFHDILSNMKEPQAFEVVARIDGPPKKGKYALTHAIVLIPYGKSRFRIKQTRAYFGFFWNRIELCCKGEVNDFSLQIRTRSPYISDDDQKSILKIRYHITQLWDDSLFNS